MKHSKFAAASALVLCAAATLMAAGDTAPEAKNQKLVMNWYREVVANGHVDLANKFMAENYVEHNPNYPGGLAEFIVHFGSVPKKPAAAKLPVEPNRVFAKGDYVVIVWELGGVDKKGTAFKYNTYDVVRVANGKVAEHWDSDGRNP
jgi:predicted SnoaL-like aldol condensation-catalyzing enzyme